MGAKTVRMTAPNGAAVEVAEERVEVLTRNGFTSEAPKTPAKKSPSSKKK